MSTFETKAGITLQLAKVNTLSLQDILFRMGYQSAAIDSEQSEDESEGEGEGQFHDYYKSLDAEQAKDVNEAMNQLLNLCCMFGVTNEVPQGAIDELKAIGFGTSSKRLSRMYWLRYLVFEDETEAALFWPAVVAFSMPEKKKSKEAKPKKKTPEKEMPKEG